MKILVTGGAGFIGSHIVDKLIENNHKVIVIDNLSSGLKEQVNQSAKLFEIDIRDKGLDDIITAEKPEIIFHLAAQMSVPYSVDNPINDLNINGNGLLNLLESARKNNVRKIIFSSTGGAIYGNAPIPTPETVTPQPLSPYGITKLLSENYLHFYKETYGLDYTILRYANVYGPRQLNAHESGVITIFINKIIKNEPIKIYAYEDEINGMIRDYIFIADVVDANIKAINAESGIYNIGTNISTNTKRLSDLICKITNNTVPVSICPPRSGDIRANTLDNSKAKKNLNWEPAYDLNKGMEFTIDYFKKMTFNK